MNRVRFTLTLTARFGGFCGGPQDAALPAVRAKTYSDGGDRADACRKGKANPIEKTRQQPDEVRIVLDKARSDGILRTLEAVRNKLDQPLPLGYCNVSVVAGAGNR